MRTTSLILLVLLSSCSGAYWQQDRHTASGKHTYFTPGWGGGCPTYNQLPIKKTNYNRQAYWHR
jgi:hypothetical protein